jgi:plastocyanin
MVGCGSYGSSPTSPADGPPRPVDAVVIDILGMNGARSFSPNPASLPVGTTVVWHNVDRETHRVVLDDRQIDTGNIAPDGFSAAMTLKVPGPYHCSIHPSMVGTLTDGVPESDPVAGGY